MGHLLRPSILAGNGIETVKAAIEEDTLRPARILWIQGLITLLVVLVIPPFSTFSQQPATGAKSATAAANSAAGKLPGIWYSERSRKDFRVVIKDDVFQAEWVNLPASAAKQGAYIRTTCRRSGTKWVGTSSVYQAAAISKGSTVPETRMCHLTVRFEVDSITPQKITFHSEALRNFDPAKCQLLQTAWEEFFWVPKK
jgi:hypothetical protein